MRNVDSLKASRSLFDSSILFGANKTLTCADCRRCSGNSSPRSLGYGEEDEMSKSLVTIEDFRRVAKALLNPESLPQQYVVEDWSRNRKFGYCTLCGEVTGCENRGVEGRDEVLCQKCRYHFGGCSGLNAERYITHVSEIPVTETTVKKLTELMPREKQKEHFAELLKSFIENQKWEVRKHKRQYRNARENVARGHELLAKIEKNRSRTDPSASMTLAERMTLAALMWPYNV